MPNDLVVIGLGYVGLPLARAAVAARLRVQGLDVSPAVVGTLNGGSSHIGDVTDAEVAEMRSGGFSATCDESSLALSSVIVITVPTPLAHGGGPDVSNVVAAARTASRLLRRGMLVVLESTTFPGTTESIVRPLLEESGLVAGRDFSLAFSPERIDPGNTEFGIHNTPKVVGGYTRSCALRAEELYRRFVSEVIIAKSCREAELAKILENVYRQVNIALANEMAVVCHRLDIDVWNAIECASTKPFGFSPFWPGPGVGGHCIPVDPNYLSYQARALGAESKLIELAQQINDSMPGYVVERVESLLTRVGKDMSSAQVLLLGVTYKPDISDLRESPAYPVAAELQNRGAAVSFHDPFIEHWEVSGSEVPREPDLDAALAAADITIVLQWHSEYRASLDPALAQALFDTHGRLELGPATVL